MSTHPSAVMSRYPVHAVWFYPLIICVPCRNKADFVDDVREQYKEMRDEFMAGLEDRKYLTIEQVRDKGLQASSAACHSALTAYALLQQDMLAHMMECSRLASSVNLTLAVIKPASSLLAENMHDRIMHALIA